MLYMQSLKQSTAILIEKYVEESSPGECIWVCCSLIAKYAVPAAYDGGILPHTVPVHTRYGGVSLMVFSDRPFGMIGIPLDSSERRLEH
jgi:hypothetical protein